VGWGGRRWDREGGDGMEGLDGSGSKPKRRNYLSKRNIVYKTSEHFIVCHPSV